jgi:hypothetical protein
MRGGALVQWRRDAEGSVVQSQSDAHLETYARDTFGRLLRRHGDGIDVSYRYDTEDQCISAAREGGPRIEFERDVAGQVVRYAVDGEVTEVEREGEWISALRSEAESVAMTWDGAGRLLSCEDSVGTRTFTYREDGLLRSFSTEAHACTLERNPLGVVLSQTVGDAVVASPDVDHRGHRYGLDLPGGASIFYLWSTSGALERIGLVGDVPFEIDLEASPDGARGVARHGEARAEYITFGEVASLPEITSEGPYDALHRPLRTAAGDALVWDEGRVVIEGDAMHVFALPSENRLATVRGEALAFHEPNDASVPASAVAACHLDGPRPSHLFALTPEAVLAQAFARRVWNPTPRPIAGEGPWSADDWVPTPIDPKVGPVRLDTMALLRLLSPFPRPPLKA